MGFKLDDHQLTALLSELPRTQLEEIVVNQASLIFKLQAKLEFLEQEICELNQRPPRATAPFRRNPDELSRTPQKPGNKKGHPGHFRQPPTPTEIIDVPLAYCPDCFCPVEHLKHHTQTIEEIPMVEVKVIQINTQSGVCPKCSRKVRSSHPLQTSAAKGAASTSLGPNAVALAVELQFRFKLSKSKTCAILAEFFGIHLTPGGLVNLSHRMAHKLRPEYQQLLRQVQQSSHLHADETGWYVGSPGYQLCVFTNPSVTLYHIAQTRNREMVKNILGDYQGVLISDCLSIYDEVNPLQQKCYAHHFRAIQAAHQKMPGENSLYLDELKLLLQTAMTLKTLQNQFPAQQWKEKIQHLETWATNLLEVEQQTVQLQPEEEAVRRRICKQRDHLFEFLKHKEVPATNNQAERQLRPAVIARKISCGNRTPKGATTWEILTSLAVTSAQQNQSFKDLIKNAVYR
jgi:transposase